MKTRLNVMSHRLSDLATEMIAHGHAGAEIAANLDFLLGRMVLASEQAFMELQHHPAYREGFAEMLQDARLAADQLERLRREDRLLADEGRREAARLN